MHQFHDALVSFAERREIDMKKIAMITFHASHNNGSMLQALALQNALINRGCEVEIIDFSNDGQRNLYAPIPKAHNWKQQIKKFVWMTNIKELNCQYKAYDAFSKKYFRLTSESYNDSSKLKELEKKYDAFVTGSDQVWNIKCIDADDAYFLNFVEDKPKYAYAVSLGANNAFAPEENGKYVNYIKSFANISVRENNAQKWIREATGENVPICLDPTMLYDASDWERMVSIEEKPIIEGKYIFYYCFGISEDIQRFLQKISTTMKLPVFFIEAKEWTLKMCWRHGIKLVKHYGPDVYMNLVKYADVFITSSFHGTAFATIYRKNFWYIRSKDSESSMDDRATTFLTQLGLMNRYKTINELESINLYDNIDYNSVVENLNVLRIKSNEYLDSLVREI